MARHRTRVEQRLLAVPLLCALSACSPGTKPDADTNDAGSQQATEDPTGSGGTHQTIAYNSQIALTTEAPASDLEELFVELQVDDGETVRGVPSYDPERMTYSSYVTLSFGGCTDIVSVDNLDSVTLYVQAIADPAGAWTVSAGLQSHGDGSVEAWGAYPDANGTEADFSADALPMTIGPYPGFPFDVGNAVSGDVVAVGSFTVTVGTESTGTHEIKGRFALPTEAIVNPC